MSQPRPNLVWRPARAERYDGLSFLIFVASPALLTAGGYDGTWWLAMAMLVGAWLLTRS